jgi:hypothetical protein
MNIAIFIHIAVIGRYRERLLQYFNKLKDSSLLEHSNYIFLNYVGNDETFEFLSEFNIFRNINIQKMSDNLLDYELPTLNNLYYFAKNNPNFKILYIHTKGVHNKLNLCVEDWVEYMTYFLINKWKTCINTLDNYDTVGVDLRDYPVLHYSGNFWWSTSDHIKTLPEPIDFNNIEKYPNPINSQRHNQEFWICYNHKKHQILWDCNINCYERHLHRYTKDKYQL